MKLCFILPSLSAKGPNFVARDIINGILDKSNDYKIDVFYFDSNDGDAIIEFKVPVKRISFFQKINFNEYDIVHSHMLKPDLFVFYNKVLNRKYFKCRTITTLHQLDYENLKYDYNNKIKAGIYSLLWRAALSLHDKVVCLSKSMEVSYRKRIINKNIIFINNGRDVSSQKKQNYKSASELNILSALGTACLLTKRKGLDQVIRAIVNLENVHFYIAGSGPEEVNLRLLANKLNISERVHFLGFVDDVPGFLSNLDVFILPSRAEGFPLALIEAMGIGLACISSNLEVITESFTENEVAQFNLEDINNLENKIIDVVKENEKYARHAYQCYIERFTTEVMTDKYISTYKEILK